MYLQYAISDESITEMGSASFETAMDLEAQAPVGNG